MAEKLNDHKLKKVVGGDEEGITYKYDCGVCFCGTRVYPGYFRIIEQSGYLDKISNTPVYKCSRFSAPNTSQINSSYSELYLDEKTLNTFEMIERIPYGI